MNSEIKELETPEQEETKKELSPPSKPQSSVDLALSMTQPPLTLQLGGHMQGMMM
jgi:hypothetical protein